MSSSLTLHAWYDVDNGPLRMDYNHFNLYEFIAIIRLNLIETQYTGDTCINQAYCIVIQVSITQIWSKKKKRANKGLL